MKKRAVEDLQQSLLQLKTDMEREQDAAASAATASLRAEHEHTLSQAKAALDMANATAVQNLREKKRCVWPPV